MTLHNGRVRTPMVEDVVGWQVQQPTQLVRLGRMTVTLVEMALAAGTYSSVDSLGGRPRLPDDPTEDLPLDAVFIEGQAPWMPPPWTGKQLVGMTLEQATINPAGLDSTRRALPLRGLQITAARSRSRSRRPKHASAPWVIDVSDGHHTLVITGPWLSLAWLGHLANWPEPDPPARS